jgi:hypothetical protein
VLVIGTASPGSGSSSASCSLTTRGWIGGIIGLALGAFMATVFEDYMDQNSD